MKKLFSKKNFFFVIALFVLGLFAYMTYRTPLAGDDWGYALNGRLGNPIKMAIEFYNGWSGRFFSELWGMIVPTNKWLWNIINPFLFFGIYICIYKLCEVKNKPLIVSLFIIVCMLSVDDNLRMETYTWIMGTTYVIPLLFSLVYFLIVEKIIVKEEYSKKDIILSYLSNILLFVIGLMMENIAATMIVAIIVLIIYSYFNNKKVIKYLIINLFFSIISFVIMRASPGSAYRLMNEHAVWAKMSVFERIASSYPNFLDMTFINNNYAIALFSILLALLILFSKNNIKKIYKVISIIISLLGIVSVFSFVVGTNILNDSSSIFSMLFWPIYVLNAFATIYLGIKDNMNKSIFMLMIAGCNALVMLYSPIYGSRSAIFTVYYLIVTAILILDELDLNKIFIIGLTLLLLIIIVDRTNEYITKYKLVGLREKERQEVIKYYQEHPEDEEAWIPRFPIFSIHGADVEPDDTYHLETFKDYYNLPQDADKITFFFVEDK